MNSKLTVGSIVFVHPSSSMRFGGRWGKLIALKGGRDECEVIFREGGYGYRFSRSELVVLADYINILIQSKTKLIRHMPTATDYHVSELLPSNVPNTFSIRGKLIHVKELYPVMRCSVCGTDTTEEFTHTCLECSHPIN